MADRRFPIVTGEFYHIFNRGVAKQPTFLNRRDYQQAMLALSYYRFKNPPVKLSRFKELASDERARILLALETDNKTLVKIVCFVLMPNHFHFLLQQTVDGGIAQFISKFTNSFTKYFNTKLERVGPMFQGVYKAVHVPTDEQLIHLSRYIHINPVVSHVIKASDLSSYEWSSLPDYLKGKSFIVWLEPILSHFSSSKDYEKFVFDQVDYVNKQDQIKHLILEGER